MEYLGDLSVEESGSSLMSKVDHLWGCRKRHYWNLTDFGSLPLHNIHDVSASYWVALSLQKVLCNLWPPACRYEETTRWLPIGEATGFCLLWKL